MRANALLLCLVMLPALAWGEDFVCGTDADTVDGGLRAYRRNIDPTQAQADCYQVPEVQQAAQRALVDSTDRRKLRVDTVAHLAVLKSQSVRDAIDAADAAAAAEAAALAAELAGAGCASDSLAEAEQKIHTQMDIARASANAITNVATAKTAALAIIDKSELILVNVARCFYALLRTTR